ncbi:hypothetical protein Pan241w_28660 [Gimesia alba]|uniref:Uncharacterized protein n=1 Tax=Gimesia alba TaxID=2527973 RepID=A0A517RFZ1_9PLAN|nr:hypothetical protein [Gimesia alba]QDT42777.1 hypothetical protein Pan241w_28660 [Gimesia alba]
MRFLLVPVVLCIWESASVAQTPPEFRDWNQFPASFHWQHELVSGSNDEQTFQLGHVIFSCSDSMMNPQQKSIPLEAVAPVAQVVAVSEPDAAYLALINQQRQQKLACQFQKARLVPLGDSELVDNPGFRWEVTWKLIPIYGGLIEAPSRIQLFVSAEGKPIPHKRYLIDAVSLKLPRPKPDPEVNPRFRHTQAPKIWLCSTLKLGTEKTRSQHSLSLTEIQDRGKKAFQEMIDLLHSKSQADSFQFRFVNVQSARLPWSMGADGKIAFLNVWAVNFQSVKAKETQTPADIFTVWVTPDGTVSRLQILDERDRN